MNDAEGRNMNAREERLRREKEKQQEAKIHALVVAIFLAILFMLIKVIFRGLTNKSKFVRYFTAILLIGIGVFVYMVFIADNTEGSKKNNCSQSFSQETVEYQDQEVEYQNQYNWPMLSSEHRNESSSGTEQTKGYVWAYHTTTGGGVEITEVKRFSSSPVKTLVVPSKLGGHPVKGIGSFAFGECEEITCVTIPEGVVNIGSYAFSNCDNLEAVTLPNSVTDIGYHAFDNCVNLKQLELPARFQGTDKREHWGCAENVAITFRGG